MDNTIDTTIYVDPFDDWFEETRGTSVEIELDVDDVDYEHMEADKE